MGVTAAASLAAIVLAAAGPRIVSSLADSDAAAAGVSAALVKGAPGASLAGMIDELARREAIKPSTEKTVVGHQKANPISSRGYVVGLGGALYFYYRDPAPRSDPPTVCRVKAVSNIRSAERLRAVRWCYQALGSTPSH
jgi:hypothetical protein